MARANETSRTFKLVTLSVEFRFKPTNKSYAVNVDVLDGNNAVECRDYVYRAIDGIMYRDFKNEIPKDVTTDTDGNEIEQIIEYPATPETYKIKDCYPVAAVDVVATMPDYDFYLFGRKTYGDTTDYSATIYSELTYPEKERKRNE